MREVYETGVAILRTLQNAGHTSYFAGGYVRDLLLKIPSDDIDIVTDADTDAVARLFKKTIPVGISFGIIIVVENGHSYEVASFRKEARYEDGRRPSVVANASPQEDAQRRDFTINGMFYDPLTDDLIDYVDGRADIKRKIIRAIGNPDERFFEDRLRMIRAVRYSAKLGFTIDPPTYEAIAKHAHLLFPSVAIERVWHEFQKMARSRAFDIALCTLHRLRLLPTIFPILATLPIEEVEKRLAPLQSCPKQTPTILLVMHLFANYTLEEKQGICNYLKLSKTETNHVIEQHAVSHTLAHSNPSRYRIAQMAAHPWFMVYLEIYAASLPLEEREALIATYRTHLDALAPHIDRLRQNKRIVSADALVLAGVPRGPRIGELLSHAEAIAVNEDLLSERDVLEVMTRRGLL